MRDHFPSSTKYVKKNTNRTCEQSCLLVERSKFYGNILALRKGLTTRVNVKSFAAHIWVMAQNCFALNRQIRWSDKSLTTGRSLYLSLLYDHIDSKRGSKLAKNIFKMQCLAYMYTPFRLCFQAHN